MENLIKIQSELKAPKGQTNKFGNYKYRSCEDVLEALKPLLRAYGMILTITDQVHEIGSITYIEATARIVDKENNFVEVKAQAGIDINQKGMSIAQCFGASSSYARKYALNGLFLIDDTKDADATNTHESAPKAANKAISTPEQSLELAEIIKAIKKASSKEDLAILWDSLDESEQKQTKAIFTRRKQELS